MRPCKATFGKQDITDYTYRAETYDVILRLDPAQRVTPQDLHDLYVRSASSGELVSLRQVLTLREIGVPRELRRVNRLPSVTLSASLAPGTALGDALAQLDALASAELPSTARLDYLGRSRDFKESAAGVYMAFAMALVIVALVLAAQFESFIQPLIILFSVPLAVTGGLLALLLFGLSFNVFSQIGLILVIGLMAKNGILVVEFANQLRDRRHDLGDAVFEAAVTRFRPVLMTSVATACGAVPLALASGAGAEGRTAIGVTVIGGIIVATLMTLLLVPVMYVLLARFSKPAGRIARRLNELEREHRQRNAVEES